MIPNRPGPWLEPGEAELLTSRMAGALTALGDLLSNYEHREIASARSLGDLVAILADDAERTTVLVSQAAYAEHQRHADRGDDAANDDGGED